MYSLQKRVAGILFFILPLAYLSPQWLKVMGMKIEWFEIVFYLALLLGPPRKGYGFVFPLVLLVGVATFANLLAIVIWGMSFSLHDFSLVKYFICYLGAIHLGLHLSEHKFNKPDLIALCIFLFFVAMTVAAVSSIEIRNAIRNIYGMEDINPHVLRVRLIGFNPIKISVTTIILYFFASKGRPFSSRSVLYLLGLIPLFFARQRAGMILFSTLFFVLEFHVVKKRILTIITIGVLALIFVMGTNSNVIQRRVELLTLSKSIGGMTERLGIFYQSIEGIVESPVIGHGHINKRGKNRNFKGYVHRDLHNTYLQFFFEYGVFGMMTLFYFIIILIHRFKLFRRFARINFYNRNIQREKNVFLALLVVYLIAMIGWYTFHLVDFSSFFFLIFGYMFAQLNRMRKQYTIYAT